MNRFLSTPHCKRYIACLNQQSQQQFIEYIWLLEKQKIEIWQHILKLYNTGFVQDFIISFFIDM